MSPRRAEIIYVDSESRRVSQEEDFELVAVAAVSSTRGPVYCSLIRPENPDPSRWSRPPYLGRILATSPTREQVTEQLKELLYGKDIGVWGSDHEKKVFPFLEESDRAHRFYRVQDVMERAAPYLKPWNAYFGNYEWSKQTDASRAFGLSYDRPGPHNALADALMTQKIDGFLNTKKLIWVDSPESSKNVVPISRAASS